jgi:hypothetical protein
MANQEPYNKIKAVYDKNHETYGSPHIYRTFKGQAVTRNKTEWRA